MSDPASRSAVTTGRIWRIRLVYLLFALVWTALATLALSAKDVWPDAVLRAEASGAGARPADFAMAYGWRALVVDLILTGLLALTARWWIGRPAAEPPRYREPAIGRRGLAVVFAILVVAAWWRAPRMGLSFYNDEAHNFVRYVCGDWKQRDSDDPGRFRQAKWSETLWLNTAGNNSQPYSLLSRLSYERWRAAAGAAEGEVNEASVRLPALAAGMLSLVALGLAVRALAGNAAGLWAMAAGSLHGWHLRYSTEARGYSLMLLGVCLSWWFLYRAVTDGRWRNWAGYGASLLLIVWSFPGSIYFLAVQNALLMVWLLRKWSKKEICWPLPVRPVIAGLAAVIVALPLLLPLLPGTLATLRDGAGIRGAMGPSWLPDLVGYLLLGCPPAGPGDADPQLVIRSAPSWYLAGLALTAAVVIPGTIRLLRFGGVATLMAVTGPIALAVAWLSMNAKGLVLHHWYGLYALPGVLAALAAGICRFGRWQAAVGAFVLLLTGAAAWKLRSVAKQDERGPVTAIRGAVYPHYSSHSALAAGFWCNSVIYDPRMLALSSDDDLATLVERARAEDRELYVAFSHRDLAMQGFSRTIGRLENVSEFDRIAVFPGLDDPQFSMYVFRLRPVAAATPGFDDRRTGTRAP